MVMFFPARENVGEVGRRHLPPALQPLRNVADSPQKFVQSPADGRFRRDAKREHGRGEAGAVGEQNDTRSGQVGGRFAEEMRSETAVDAEERRNGLFLVACYATLYVNMSVDPLVRYHLVCY